MSFNGEVKVTSPGVRSLRWSICVQSTAADISEASGPHFHLIFTRHITKVWSDQNHPFLFAKVVVFGPIDANTSFRVVGLNPNGVSLDVSGNGSTQLDDLQRDFEI